MLHVENGVPWSDYQDQSTHIILQVIGNVVDINMSLNKLVEVSIMGVLGPLRTQACTQSWQLGDPPSPVPLNDHKGSKYTHPSLGLLGYGIRTHPHA